MADRHRVYEALVRLYPREFRQEYGAELIEHFAEFAADRGARAAWTRTSLDLTITIPRFNLENLMTEHRSTVALNVTIGLLAAGGLTIMIVGGPAGGILLAAACVLMLSQRSTLARALRVPDSDRRRHRLRAAVVLGAIFVATFTTFLLTAGDTWKASDTVLYLIGTAAMFGAPCYLVAGLLTPRAHNHRPLTESN